jgi:sterol desaturase/sphingolipid hydroxylase (fatty acid hydroxylase superfamily)
VMEHLTYQDIESFGLVVFALAFVCLERLFPKNPDLGIKEQLKLDLMGFIVLVVGVNLSRLLVTFLYEGIHLKQWTLISGSAEWPFILRLICVHVISDFVLYWIHRGMHGNAFLWKTHQWHHSAEKLYWFSGFRTSLTHAFLYAFPQVFVGFYLFHFTPLELGIGFTLGVISNLFTHSNLSVPAWLPLHWVLVTPDYHHPHHSQMGTQNKNFGNVFTVWDRVFGTYVDPSLIKKNFKYGLKEKPKSWRMMIGL